MITLMLDLRFQGMHIVIKSINILELVDQYDWK
jgi:hypothetical protein